MANIALVRGDGGAKDIQQSGITVDDSDNLNPPSGAAHKLNSVRLPGLWTASSASTWTLTVGHIVVL